MSRFEVVVSLLYLMADASLAGPALLPDRVAKAAQERIEAATYQTLIFGIVAGDQSEAVAFGKLDNGKAPDGDTVYEIGSITKTFTATLLADAVLSGRFTLDTPLADLLPDFRIPERNGNKITLGEIGMQYSGLPRMPSNLLPKDPANPFADYDGLFCIATSWHRRIAHTPIRRFADSPIRPHAHSPIRRRALELRL
jgi:D-alanyl-D-alanine-carboxypeptidase/D-alanyl-D-alanine-endopeptidase